MSPNPIHDPLANITTNAEAIDESVQPEPNRLRQALKHFAAGFLFSGFPIFIYTITSMYATHSSLAQMGTVTVGSAIAIPIICGVVAMLFPKRMINILQGIFEALPI